MKGKGKRSNDWYRRPFEQSDGEGERVHTLKGVGLESKTTRKGDKSTGIKCGYSVFPRNVRSTRSTQGPMH